MYFYFYAANLFYIIFSITGVLCLLFRLFSRYYLTIQFCLFHTDKLELIFPPDVTPPTPAEVARELRVAVDRLLIQKLVKESPVKKTLVGAAINGMGEGHISRSSLGLFASLTTGRPVVNYMK